MRGLPRALVGATGPCLHFMHTNIRARHLFMAKNARLDAYELTRNLSTAKIARICVYELTRMEFFRSGVTHLLASDYST